ncbi:hypothetical protein KW787_03315 [Candidatus Pacearchaeota archaeon]|nr:hypothetical protein [Candidatus Pacearchaeota archaeon]
MEKEIDRIQKSSDTDIVIRIDEFNGKTGVTIREFVRSDRYQGFTKAGTRIPADKFHLFRQAINSIKDNDLSTESAPQDRFIKPISPPKREGINPQDEVENRVEHGRQVAMTKGKPAEVVRQPGDEFVGEDMDDELGIDEEKEAEMDEDLEDLEEIEEIEEETF